MPVFMSPPDNSNTAWPCFCASLRNESGTADYTDGSVTISGNVLTFTDSTGAEGLKIVYTGDSDTDIEISVSAGLASSFFHTLDSYADNTSGLFSDKQEILNESITDKEERITTLEARLNIYEETIRAQFTATEQAMATAQALLDALDQQFNNNDN